MSNKEIRQFLRQIEADGWTWSRRKSGHLRLKGPRGELVFTGSTPGDRRAIMNLKTDMRRAREQVSERR